MNICGIIAEYNPFHNGHAYQIQYTKEMLKADYVIIVMSGDFVQRGTPAILPKHLRAEMALRGGADLVLELPVTASTASAEFFAEKGVELLDSLGVVNTLCFGSEAGSVEALLELASLFVEEPEDYRNILKEELRCGASFPAARTRAVLEYFRDARHFPGDDFDGALMPLLNQIGNILTSPNNILGVEYCKALIRRNSSIRPVSLKREGLGYHDTKISSQQYPSASAIRQAITQNHGKEAGQEPVPALGMPEDSFHILEDARRQNAFLTEADLDLLLHYRLLGETANHLCTYLDVSPALAQRICNRRNEYQGFSQFASVLKTKELTQTRIHRALLHILLHIHNVPPAVSYARILGFRKDSAPLLAKIKADSSIPLLAKLADAPAVLDAQGIQILEKNTFASNVYESLLASKTGQKFLHEYQKPVVIV